MKGSIDKIINLLYTLQMTKSITYYCITYPANTIIYIDQLRSLVDAEMLKPDKILNFLGFEVTLKELLTGESKEEEEKKELPKVDMSQDQCN